MSLLLTLFACSSAPVVLDTDADAPCEQGIQIGDCAPDFTLPDRDGEDVSLSDHEGELILINCSAMW